MKKLILGLFVLCFLAAFITEQKEVEYYYQHPSMDMPIPENK